MPPLPKRRLSLAKQRTRAAHYKVAAQGVGACPTCHQPKLPHRVCSNCGSYNGRTVLQTRQQQ